MWTVFLRVRFVVTFAFDVRRATFAERSTMGTLRDRTAFLVDMNQLAVYIVKSVIVVHEKGFTHHCGCKMTLDGLEYMPRMHTSLHL